MRYYFHNEQLGSFIGLSTDYVRDGDVFTDKRLISFFWNKSDQPFKLQIDTIPYILHPQQLTTCTYLNRLSFQSTHPLVAICFNREFYCIQDHDHEVSCNGILFFGTREAPIITLKTDEARSFDLLYQIFIEEFTTRDDIQEEMLRMLLKRLIIKTTRLAREQLVPKEMDDTQIDLIRKFNVLVDMHFREKKRVADYAEMLYKSPKTLSNLFAQFQEMTPIQVIHDRIVTEAKRQLLYTDKTVKEIAHELGYRDDRTLHKIFRKITSQTPHEFKTKHTLHEKEI